MIGRSIGNYQIKEKIGEGGMGTVYLGVDTMLDREVAIKSLHPELLKQAKIVERFRAEAVTLAKINHPHIAMLYTLIRQTDELFMILEYVKGNTLEEVLLINGAFSYEVAVPMFCQILDGMSHAHELNIIHRDIKPGNLMLTEKGVLKVLDFGIARLLGSTRMTKFGNTIGTLEYISPEQIRGLETDARSDIYSLGITLYEMLTGRVPFITHSEYDLMFAQINNLPPPPREFNDAIPENIQKAILKALAKSPDERFQTTEEFMDSLAFAGGQFPNKLYSFAENKFTTIETKDSFSKITNNSLVEETSETNQENNSIIPENIKPTRLSPNEHYSKQNLLLDSDRLNDVSLINKSDAQKKVDPIKKSFNLLKGVQKQLTKYKTNLLISGIIFITLLSITALFLPSTNSIKKSAVTESNVEIGNIPIRKSAKVASSHAIQSAPKGMVYVTGGEFDFGKGLKKAYVKPFFIDVYEVTNEEYEKFVLATGRKPPPTWKRGQYLKKDAKKPVTGIKWDDAVEFANWVGKRLPTEEEWEFAARGKDGSIYPWGEEWESGMANANGVSKELANVGTYKGVSPFGVYDMSGNAWEWTATDFKQYENEKKINDLPKGQLKTLRGGSFESTSKYATAIYRIGYPARSAEDYSRTSFRCVKDAQQ